MCAWAARWHCFYRRGNDHPCSSYLLPAGNRQGAVKAGTELGPPSVIIAVVCCAADCSTAAEAATLFGEIDRTGLVVKASSRQEAGPRPHRYPWDDRARTLRNRGSIVKGDDILRAAHLSSNSKDSKADDATLVPMAFHSNDDYLADAASAIAEHNKETPGALELPGCLG